MAPISGKFLNEQGVLRMPRHYYYSYPYYFLNVCSANVGNLEGKWVEVGKMMKEKGRHLLHFAILSFKNLRPFFHSLLD